MTPNIFYNNQDYNHSGGGGLDIGRVTAEIPSAGKDLGKIGFFNIEAQSMVHDRVIEPPQQQ